MGDIFGYPLTNKYYTDAYRYEVIDYKKSSTGPK